ncbi:alpha/beta fold hydrolase [Agaribacterium sp. ZY112]|uniref:alpha/beta fold hydrolase n=1 Tax=Agaribacterium sp. ZY112 TaxID=3233574 RepID=UPI0035250434
MKKHCSVVFCIPYLLSLLLLSLLFACDNKQSTGSGEPHSLAQAQALSALRSCSAWYERHGLNLRCYRFRELDRKHQTRVAIISNVPPTEAKANRASKRLRQGSKPLAKEHTNELLPTEVNRVTDADSRISKIGKEERTAVVYIPGGPGQGALSSDYWLQLWLDWYAEHQPSFDLVLYDPPATHGSSIDWRCKPYEQLSFKLLALDISAEEEAAELDPVLNQCLEQYHQRLIKSAYDESGLASFTTKRNVDFMSSLLDALPYSAINLWGASYGTRVAMFAAEHKKVQTLILESAFPPPHGGFLSFVEMAPRSLNLHQDLAYQKMGSHYDYAAIYKQAQQQLNQQSLSFSVTHWSTSKQVNFVLNAQRLYNLHINQLYNPSDVRLWYTGLYAIAHANIETGSQAWIELAQVIELFLNNAFDPDFNSLNFIATDCQDALKPQKVTFERLAAQDNYSGMDWQWWWENDLCAYPVFTLASEIQKNKPLEKPVLLVSGHFDLVTPNEWAEELLQFYPRAQLMYFPMQAHTPLLDWPCSANILSAFVTKQGAIGSLSCELLATYSAEQQRDLRVEFKRNDLDDNNGF